MGDAPEPVLPEAEEGSEGGAPLQEIIPSTGTLNPLERVRGGISNLLESRTDTSITATVNPRFENAIHRVNCLNR